MPSNPTPDAVHPTVKSGLDVLSATDFASLSGQRLGLLTNLSAADATLISAYQQFTQHPQLNLVAPFAPEHSLGAIVAEGEAVASTVDARNGVQIHIMTPGCWQALSAWLSVIMTIAAMYPAQLAWNTDSVDRLRHPAYSPADASDASR